MSEEKFGQAKRNAKKIVEDAANSKDLKTEGKGDKVSGKAKKVVDDAKDKANGLIDRAKGDKN